MSDEASADQMTFAPPRTLANVRFGLLGAFELDTLPHNAFPAGNLGRLVWASNGSTETTRLQAFSNIEEFLLEKQLFFGQEQPNVILRPQRAISHDVVDLSFLLEGRSIVAKFDVIVSWFEKHSVLSCFLFTEFSEITVDDLIFLKELKWFKDTGDPCIMIGGEGATALSIHDAMGKILVGLGVRLLKDPHFPIFDFIEICGVGPAIGAGPTEYNRLTLSEHWGILAGDEGYRLLDENEEKYSIVLSSDDIRFRGRSYFLYQFFPTSSLCFVSKNIDEIKSNWKAYYRKHERIIPVLDSYIGITTAYACLRDGIPIFVEIALLRYIELTRTDRALAGTDWSPFRRVVTRFAGAIQAEHGAERLHRINLYLESALWIIGGNYADQLYQYNKIWSRVERTMQLHQSSLTNLRAALVGVFSIVGVFVAIFIALHRLMTGAG